jgi:hypothetical protein
MRGIQACDQQKWGPVLRPVARQRVNEAAVYRVSAALSSNRPPLAAGADLH